MACQLSRDSSAARRGGGGAGRAVPYVTRYTPKAVDRGWIGGALVQPLASAPALFLGWTPGFSLLLGGGTRPRTELNVCFGTGLDRNQCSIFNCLTLS